MLNERTKSFLGSVFKLAVAVGLITWLIATGRLDVHLASSLFRDPMIIAGFALTGLNIFLNSERWRILATPQNINAGSFEVFRLSLIGLFFNYAMPGGVGGDVVKAYYFGKDHPEARAAAITSVVLDRALGLYAMILMATVVMILDFKHVSDIPTLRTLFIMLLCLSFAFSLALLSIFSRRIKRRGWVESLLTKLPFQEKFMKLYETAHRFGEFRGRVLSVLALSLASQSVAILFLWLAGQKAGFVDVQLSTYFLVAPLGYMATAIPISPAGLGVGQAAFLVLFNIYLGYESQVGPTVITTQQVVSALFGLVGAFYYVRRKDRHLPQAAT